MASIELRKSVNGYEPYAILTVSQGTQSVPGNYTQVSWSLVLYRPKSVSSSSNKSYSVTVGGQTWSGSYSISGSGAKTIASGTKTVYHDVNGVGSVAFSASVQFGITWSGTAIGTVSNSSSMTLSRIPRVSDISLNKTELLADGSQEIIATVTKKSSAFTDTVNVTLGSYSSSVTSGVAFTIPKDWINAITGTAATATVTVTTKSGSTVIGSKSATFTVNVPTSVVPSISNVTAIEANSVVTAAFADKLIQTLSKLDVEVTAEGVYGSTITSVETVIDGIKYMGASFVSDNLASAGTVNIVTTVTDSRGRTKSFTKTIEVVAYAPPTLFEIGAEIVEGKLFVIIKGKVYPVDNMNTKFLKIRYKTVSSETWSPYKAVTLSGYDFSVGNEYIVDDISFDDSVTYDVEAMLTDAISSSKLSTATGITVLSLYAGGGGAALFQEADREGLVVGGNKPAYFTGCIYIYDEELEMLLQDVFAE